MSAEYWDHRRDLAKHDPSPRHQKRAVSELVGYLHGLMSAGMFSGEIEKQLHARVRNTCMEFEMDPPPFPGSDTGAFM